MSEKTKQKINNNNKSFTTYKIDVIFYIGSSPDYYHKWFSKYKIPEDISVYKEKKNVYQWIAM